MRWFSFSNYRVIFLVSDLFGIESAVLPLRQIATRFFYWITPIISITEKDSPARNPLWHYCRAFKSLHSTNIIGQAISNVASKRLLTVQPMQSYWSLFVCFLREIKQEIRKTDCRATWVIFLFLRFTKHPQRAEFSNVLIRSVANGLAHTKHPLLSMDVMLIATFMLNPPHVYLYPISSFALVNTEYFIITFTRLFPWTSDLFTFFAYSVTVSRKP